MVAFSLQIVGVCLFVCLLVYHVLLSPFSLLGSPRTSQVFPKFFLPCLGRIERLKPVGTGEFSSPGETGSVTPRYIRVWSLKFPEPRGRLSPVFTVAGHISGYRGAPSSPSPPGGFIPQTCHSGLEPSASCRPGFLPGRRSPRWRPPAGDGRRRPWPPCSPVPLNVGAVTPVLLC